jgi:glycosyltransferase involved in cell wall biosynthesis
MEKQAMTTSIIIPCYNEKNAIRDTIDCIRAVIHQSGINGVDIIAVNDGSSDGSEHVLNSLAEDNQINNLLVVHHKRNQGYGAALKTGIRRSQSDYICITDADGTYPN